MVKYPFWVQKIITLYDTTWGWPPYRLSTNVYYLRGRLRLTTARRLSAYMSSRALATTTTSSSPRLINNVHYFFPRSDTTIVTAMRMGNLTQAFEWYHFQWPWLNPNVDSSTSRSSKTVAGGTILRHLKLTVDRFKCASAYISLL